MWEKLGGKEEKIINQCNKSKLKIFYEEYQLNFLLNNKWKCKTHWKCTKKTNYTEVKIGMLHLSAGGT